MTKNRAVGHEGHMPLVNPSGGHMIKYVSAPDEKSLHRAQGADAKTSL